MILEDKMLVAFLISIILSVLLFRTNYTKDIKVSRAKYTEKGKYNYSYMLTDVLSSVSFSIVGCYLAWDSIATIEALKEYENYKFIYSILNGILFQQILPIIIEVAMNKINAVRNSEG
jgi:hypothetical protein